MKNGQEALNLPPSHNPSLRPESLCPSRQQISTASTNATLSMTEEIPEFGTINPKHARGLEALGLSYSHEKDKDDMFILKKHTVLFPLLHGGIHDYLA